MTGRDVARLIRQHGGVTIRQKGSHIVMRLGTCLTTVPVHGVRDLPAGTLRAIERDLAPCVGRVRWVA